MDDQQPQDPFQPQPQPSPVQQPQQSQSQPGQLQDQPESSMQPPQQFEQKAMRRFYLLREKKKMDKKTMKKLTIACQLWYRPWLLVRYKPIISRDSHEYQ